jgi:hypothetical protein
MDDIIGKKFGKWTVLEEAGMASKSFARYLCRCDCGVQEFVSYKTLVKPNIVGCLACRAKKSGFGRMQKINLKRKETSL